MPIPRITCIGLSAARLDDRYFPAQQARPPCVIHVGIHGSAYTGEYPIPVSRRYTNIFRAPRDHNLRNQPPITLTQSVEKTVTRYKNLRLGLISLIPRGGIGAVSACSSQTTRSLRIARR